MPQTKHHPEMLTYPETARFLNEIGFKTTIEDLYFFGQSLDFLCGPIVEGVFLLPWAETLEWAETNLPKWRRTA
jgi:hypothetical protein